MRRSQSSASIEVGFQDTLVDLFGERESRNHQELKDNPSYRQFQKKFRDIFEIGARKHVPDGEIQIMIHKQYNVHLDSIQYGTLDEVKTFIENNIENRYIFIDPELHAYLLRCDYYNKSPTNVAPKAMAAAYARKVVEMMASNCSIQDHIECGVLTSKCRS